jgi:hypothetical protein
MRERIIYNIPIPSGAGQNPDGKPVPATAPSLGGNCFMNMRTPKDLDTLCASAPSSQSVYMSKLRAAGARKTGHHVPANMPREEVYVRPVQSIKTQKVRFVKGADVKDLSTSRRGIIIQANAGYTAKTHKPVHRLCDARGNTWLAKEKNLKLIY